MTKKQKFLDDVSPAEWDSQWYKPRKVPAFVEAKSACGDPVDQPDHYNTGAIEAIEAIKASMHPQEFRGYLKGNVMKYIWRYEYKGKPVEDLRKARWYLERLIKENL